MVSAYSTWGHYMTPDSLSDVGRLGFVPLSIVFTSHGVSMYITVYLYIFSAHARNGVVSLSAQCERISERKL